MRTKSRRLWSTGPGGSSDWSERWSGAETTGYPDDTPAFLRDVAAEVRVMFADHDPGRVVELCCGNGVMFEQFGFDADRYVGVDFSESLLELFRGSHPGVELVGGDACRFSDATDVDTVFCHFSYQYFDQQQEQALVANAWSMLRPGGRLVLTLIPWSRKKLLYLRRLHHPQSRPRPLPVAAAFWIASHVQDPLGRWYDPAKTIGRLEQHGFIDPQVRGSMVMPYRFNLTMTKPAP